MYLYFFMSMSSPNPIFDHLLESSYRDDSNKQSNIGFVEQMTQAVLIEVKLKHLIWSSAMSVISFCSHIVLLEN